MKKRIVLGSIIVVLLMLVSSQIVLLNTVKSDPTSHTGDAEVGELWISELNVESAVDSFDYVGIGHVNATDDWVLWRDGTGNITACWSVHLEQELNRPEYFVRFGLVVYNVDDENKEMGNDTFMKTYTESASEIGTLTVALEFTQQQMREYSQTLVCYLEAWVTLNNTQEARNFTSFADDRAVVAVDFIPPLAVPEFPGYVDEANDKCPSMWSWIEGWDEVFETEDDMLNFQSFFETGQFQAGEPSQNDPWYLGTVTVKMGLYKAKWGGFVVDTQVKEWEENEATGRVRGDAYLNYTITGETNYGWARFRVRLWYEWPEWASPTGFWSQWKAGEPLQDSWGGEINVMDCNPVDGDIHIWGPLWTRAPLLFWYHPLAAHNYKIHIVGDAGNQGGNGYEGGTYWEEKCAYQNNSYDVNAISSEERGITTVEADIYEILRSRSSNELVYTFAGDGGDTRIKLVCQG